MNTQWIGVAISVLVVLSGLAANLFIIGRFVGQWSETMRSIAKTLAQVEARVEDVEDGREDASRRISLMDQRLGVTEQAASKFWEMRDEFTTLRVTVEQEGKHSREKLDSMARSFSVIERQLANLVTTRSGFTTLTSEDKN